MTDGASSLEAVLVRVGSVLLPAFFFWVLALCRFLITLFLFMVLLFMGGECVLNCVNEKSFIGASKRTLHPGGERKSKQSQIK